VVFILPFFTLNCQIISNSASFAIKFAINLEVCPLPRKRVIDIDGLAHSFDLIPELGPRGRGAWVYVCLWSVAEDSGVYDPDYKEIANRLGAFKFSAKEVEQFIKVLLQKKKIISFNDESGRIFHWIVNFTRHQPLKNPSPPRLPLPPWVTCELHKYKSGKQYAKFTITPGSLPVGYREPTGSLLVGSRNETETETETETNKGGADGPLLDEKEKFKEAREHLEVQANILMEHFNITEAFELEKNNGSFHPTGFIYKAVKNKIPIDVIIQVIDSMVKQRESIKNPQAWLINVLKSEYQNYNFEQVLQDHEKRKSWGLGKLGDLLR
jgi:hypothetical protein